MAENAVHDRMEQVTGDDGLLVFIAAKHIPRTVVEIFAVGAQAHVLIADEGKSRYGPVKETEIDNEGVSRESENIPGYIFCLYLILIAQGFSSPSLENGAVSVDTAP